MPSFDIVSQVNTMEIENAVNQAKKELANRFDFKGSKWEIVLEKTEIKLSADNDFKVRTVNEIVVGKLAKRGISMKSIEQGEPDISPLGHARQSIKIKQGIETAVAKEITGFIRDGKFKVTTQIQGDEVRVTAITITNTGKMTARMSGAMIIAPPVAGATPRPPWKPMKGERLCPTIAARAAATLATSLPPMAMIRSTATDALATSSNPETAAHR